jgi:DnaK suppressor protein
MPTKKTKSVKHKLKHAKKTSKKKILKPQKVLKKKKLLTKKTKSKSSTTSVKAKKAPSSLREKTITKIKKNLLSQRETLLKEAEEALNTLPGEINFPDMGDQATVETDRNFMLRLRDRERMLLKKIDEAIERIENNTFGICEECDNEIDVKRLEARPVTTLCIDCKTRQEEEERIAEGE